MPDHYDKPLPTRKPPVPSPQKDVIDFAERDYRKGGMVYSTKVKRG